VSAEDIRAEIVPGDAGEQLALQILADLGSIRVN